MSPNASHIKKSYACLRLFGWFIEGLVLGLATTENSGKLNKKGTAKFTTFY
jgi:hypothetical protein